MSQHFISVSFVSYNFLVFHKSTLMMAMASSSGLVLDFVLWLYNYFPNTKEFKS